MLKLLEKDIERSILDYLNTVGCFAFKNPTVGVYDTKRKKFRRPNNPHMIKGVADIIGINPKGKVFFCEVKSAKGRLSPHQKAFIKRVTDMGVHAFVARSIGDVKEYFEEHGL